MDWFSLIWNASTLSAQGSLQTAFACRLTGKPLRPRPFLVYLPLLLALDACLRRIPGTDSVAILTQLLVFYAVNRSALANRRSVSLIAAVLAVYISQLSFGVVNSLEVIFFPQVRGFLLYLLVVLATLLSFAFCGGCYGFLLRFFSLREEPQAPLIGLLLFPGFFSLSAELYILRTAYREFPQAPFRIRFAEHIALFSLQILGLSALFCTLYAYQRICRSFRTQAALSSIRQAAQAQKTWLAEAQSRYEQTDAFRHDLKNHLTVLSGLLNSGKTEDARQYLAKISTVSARLSFPCQTGNPAADILLKEKAEHAKANRISVRAALSCPQGCGIDDFDFCVVLANALDNAIAACLPLESNREIAVRSERQGDFYLLAVENTCGTEPLPPPGIGLSNIRAVAEKYHGTMLAEKADGMFRLHVLFSVG